MLEPAVMWILGAVIVLLPFAINYTLNGTNQSDSRGRRISRRWRGRSLVPEGTVVPRPHQDHLQH